MRLYCPLKYALLCEFLGLDLHFEDTIYHDHFVKVKEGNLQMVRYVRILA